MHLLAPNNDFQCSPIHWRWSESLLKYVFRLRSADCKIFKSTSRQMATNNANSIIIITFILKIIVIFRKNYFLFGIALFYIIPENILINYFFRNNHVFPFCIKLFNILLVWCSAFSFAKKLLFFFIHTRFRSHHGHLKYCRYFS